MRSNIFLFCIVFVINLGGSSSEAKEWWKRDGEDSSYPAVATAVLSEESTAFQEMDVLSASRLKSTRNQKNVKVEFLVHNQPEFEMIRGLDGVKDMRLDQDLTMNFLTRNAPSELNKMYAKEQNFSTIDGFPCYRDLSASFQLMDQLASNFTDLVSVLDIGDSYLKTQGDGGHDIKVLKITNKNVLLSAEKANLVLMFGLHPRELAPPELGMRLAETLVNGYGVDAEITSILDRTEVHLILQANPDARALVEGDLSTFQRKNLHQVGQRPCIIGQIGVDLNRNFPFMWGRRGASASPCAETYRGEEAASEPETRSIVDYLESVFPESQRKEDPEGNDLFVPYSRNNTGIFLDTHSYGNLIIWPWSFQNRESKNDLEMEAWARKITSFNDYTLAGPKTAGYLFEASGVSDDFGYGKLGVVSGALEIGTDFYQDCETFENTIVPDNIPMYLYLTKVARAPFALPLGPDVTTISFPEWSDDEIPSIPAAGASLTVEAIISDRALSSGLYRTSWQSVASAKLFIDEHPDDDGSSDGAEMNFGSIPSLFSRMASLTIDVSGLDVGLHTIHIQGTDRSGHDGPVTARFFQICDSSTNSSSCGGGGTKKSSVCMQSGSGWNCNPSTPCCSGVGKCDNFLLAPWLRRCA